MGLHKTLFALALILNITVFRAQSSLEAKDPLTSIVNKLTLQEKVKLLHGLISDEPITISFHLSS
ncbi:hypothetical protein D9O36_20595 [Zobellia amurskyensis]|uniref:Uncharacterized protein n=1 Tax=Zobellia amurskyensis TaxID=248905 RepID=A0A7X3D494_9FLAO|nr:hypothetical protein [Zobellia amurskyensis]